MIKLALVLLFAVIANRVSAVAPLGAHLDSQNWIKDINKLLKKDEKVTFTVALKLQNEDVLHEELLAVSSPRSKRYGEYYSHESLQNKFGPSKDNRMEVATYFKQIENVEVRGIEEIGDFLTVTAPVYAIETFMKTSLSIRKNRNNLVDKTAIRADSPLSIPYHIAKKVNFISLNTPIAHMTPRASKSLKSQQKAKVNKKANGDIPTFTNTIGLNAGNQQALVTFQPVCGDGLTNSANPPCSNMAHSKDIPIFTFIMNQYAMNNTHKPSETIMKPLFTTISLTTNPTKFTISADEIYCASSLTSTACIAGNTSSTHCICIAKISPVPKYVHLDFEVLYEFPGSSNKMSLGTSNQLALTDIATVHLLSDLYKIPSGIKVRHGSNQSVAEFYGEFYSNSDLLKFLELSGLPATTIPNSNVKGDLPNRQKQPGGEAQLDVEYITAIAPGAETYFYSFSDRNPYNYANEGFLAYLTFVSHEKYPPLVHSLSYGDIEADVFNTTNIINGSAAASYGAACDQQFAKMGLRGLSIMFSSGDDGIGNSIVRVNPSLGCSQAWPVWPAASPYVTVVGGTQLTDKYIPLCGMSYSPSKTFTDAPTSSWLNVECTGIKETTCSSTIGGIVTSGGGFSGYSSRNLAPWQEDVVVAYLNLTGVTPHPSYFNASGRAYPDVSVYASNYFVYLAGKLIRESGTSASTPVFSAMVTLWNDMRLAHGMPPMGFVAPFLYAAYADHPEAFNDITTGDNACSAGKDISTINCCSQSFKAAPGWDATSGLGSPNFHILSNLVVNKNIQFPASVASSCMDTMQSSSFNSISSIKATTNIRTVSIIAIVALLLSLFSFIYFHRLINVKTTREQEREALGKATDPADHLKGSGLNRSEVL